MCKKRSAVDARIHYKIPVWHVGFNFCNNFDLIFEVSMKWNVCDSVTRYLHPNLMYNSSFSQRQIEPVCREQCWVLNTKSSTKCNAGHNERQA